jgi:DNA-binding NtrC family response regulator
LTKGGNRPKIQAGGEYFMSATIIIVDDELDMLELLEMIITEKTPHQVVTTNNPLEVSLMMRQHEADLLVTDLRMPAMGGIELIKKIKEDYPILPIIVITAYGSSQSAEESVAAGAYDYITKPFRKDQILITINRALEWGKMKKELAALQEQKKL